METKGWDVFRNLPPETDSGSETNQVCLGHVVRVLKVRFFLKKIRRILIVSQFLIKINSTFAIVFGKNLTFSASK